MPISFIFLGYCVSWCHIGLHFSGRIEGSLVLNFLPQDQSFQVDYTNCRDVCVGECFCRPAGFLTCIAPVCVSALERLWLEEVI